MASRELSELHPAARSKAMQWVGSCKKAGVDVLVYCTYRPGDEQDKLYAIGRTVKGANVTAKKPMGDRVTNARAGQSYHQWRCAWDAVPLVHGKPMWGDTASYEIMGKVAEMLGIQWAGRWKGSLKETAHFQFTGGLSLADLNAGKVPA